MSCINCVHTCRTTAATSPKRKHQAGDSDAPKLEPVSSKSSVKASPMLKVGQRYAIAFVLWVVTYSARCFYMWQQPARIGRGREREGERVDKEDRNYDTGLSTE